MRFLIEHHGNAMREGAIIVMIQDRSRLSDRSDGSCLAVFLIANFMAMMLAVPKPMPGMDQASR